MSECPKCQLREMMKHDGPGWSDCPNCGNENMKSDIAWAGVENGVALRKVNQPERPPNSYEYVCRFCGHLWWEPCPEAKKG